MPENYILTKKTAVFILMKNLKKWKRSKYLFNKKVEYFFLNVGGSFESVCILYRLQCKDTLIGLQESN
jgi:hypothetical protein